VVRVLVDRDTTPGHPRTRIAVCVDARAGVDLLNLPAYLDAVAEVGIRPDTLFLDTSNDVIITRYSETRRRHPNAPDGDVEAGIQRERQLLEPVRARADMIIDTSASSVSELRERIALAFQGSRASENLIVTVMSFGFKYGIPHEADMVIDVRFLPNPHYDPELRPRSGSEPEIRDFVLNNDTARDFLERQQGLLKLLLPLYVAEPKSYLTIGVGCTGGRHRSVAVAHQLALFLKTLNYNPRLRHRDIDRDPR